MDDSSYQQLLDEIAKADAVIVGIGLCSRARSFSR